jgi:hypothetical protein
MQNRLAAIMDRHSGCVLAAWLGLAPLSAVTFFGVPLCLGLQIPDPIWLAAFLALAYSSWTLFMTYAVNPAMARLAAEICEPGSWKASGTGFSGRIGPCSIVAVWPAARRSFNNLMLECPARIGFLIEPASPDDLAEWIVQKVGVTQFDLFEKVPHERGDRHALQTDDLHAFIALMENARFASALAALESIPAFRCLVSLRVPGRFKTGVAGWMLSSLSGREGLVLIRMEDFPRKAAAIRKDLALLSEIRDAMAEDAP